MERILPDARKSRRPISVSVFAIVSPLDRPQHNALDEEALKERIKAKDWPGGNNDERVFHRFGHQKRRHAAVAARAALLAVVVGAEKAAQHQLKRVAGAVAQIEKGVKIESAPQPPKHKKTNM